MPNTIRTDASKGCAALHPRSGLQTYSTSVQVHGRLRYHHRRHRLRLRHCGRVRAGSGVRLGRDDRDTYGLRRPLRRYRLPATHYLLTHIYQLSALGGLASAGPAQIFQTTPPQSGAPRRSSRALPRAAQEQVYYAYTG